MFALTDRMDASKAKKEASEIKVPFGGDHHYFHKSVPIDKRVDNTYDLNRLSSVILLNLYEPLLIVVRKNGISGQQSINGGGRLFKVKENFA
ncbi:MAG: hypothetical protein JSW26_10520 [Desulfobacterales bacterium]|nr:MAG: hypothetical protein JSW26_10520 [Desulfobacterales bacterium]